MKLLNKLFPEIVAFPVLIVVFFITRFYNILSLPIFTDEAIYTRWAQIARFDPNWRFISLTDGKQPLFVWADMLVMKLFSDPLLSGRAVSVIAGFITIFGIYFLTYEVFKKENLLKARIIGIIASIIFVLYPFSLVYDRMALYESMVAMFFVWSLYLQILLVRKIRLDIAMILGIVLGSAVLTKSSGFLSIYLFPFLLFIFDFKKKGLKIRLLKFACLSLVSIVMAYAMYGILRLSSFYHIINDKNLVFVQTPAEWMKFQFADKISTFLSNFRGLWDWFFVYFTLPYIILAAASLFINIKLLKEKIVLVLWFLLPFLALCVFGKTLYPRYVLFMTMSLIPLVAYSIFSFFEKYKNIAVRIIFVLIIIILPLRSDYYILFDFANAPLPRLDLEQYINGWPSGGGVRESVEFFNDKAQSGPIYVATQGTFGLMPSSYEIYLKDNKNIIIKGFWPTDSVMPEEVFKISQKMPTYFVFYQDCSLCKFPGAAPVAWPLEKIESFNKGIGNTKLTIYQVKK
jgi:4-amino-4-deoxy-L-arabinose transferase-like glycosyltransferase